MAKSWFSATLVLAYGGGLALHWWHRDQAEHVAIPPVLHWLRDSSLSLPLALVAIAVAGAVVARPRVGRQHPSAPWTSVAAALLAAAVYAAGTVPGNVVHGRLFVGEHPGASDSVTGFEPAHLARDSGVAFAAALLALLVHGAAVGLAAAARRLPRTRHDALA